MTKQLKSIIVLTAVCVVVAACLGLTNYFTAPIIAEKQNAAANDALVQVYPEGKDFQKIDLSAYTLPSTVVGAWSVSGGGYVIQLETTGFDKGMVLMCGISPEGEVLGASCISSKETLGYEKTYGDTLVGATADTIGSYDTISGATKTTEGYRNAVKDAINAAIILGGGSVDIRDEAQILADNLAAALPTSNGAFTPVFICEVVENVKEAYKADNGAGYVYITSDDTFVGVDADGNVVGTFETEVADTILAAHAILSTTTMEEIDLTAFEGLPSSVLKAYKTATGNYVFDLRAAGFGIQGDPSHYIPANGKYIYLSVSMTADGKIISCVTTNADGESAGYGDLSAKKEYYTQYNGLTSEGVNAFPITSGVTKTTSGYKKAIQNAFKALTILKGESNE